MHNNFLKTAQWLKHPNIQIERKPLINDFDGKFVGIGSCFAQNIQTNIRPYGFDYWYDFFTCAHYSTESMANLLDLVAHPEKINEDVLFTNEGEDNGVIAYVFNFKKVYYGEDASDRLLAMMKVHGARCAEEIRDCDFLVITLGTPRVIRQRENGVVLNASSGIDQKHWFSEMISVEENVAQLERVLSYVRDIRGGNLPQLFLTVSPQRYLFSKEALGSGVDPFLDNMLGKSILRVAAETICRKYASNIEYFPSYEIVIDELRMVETLSHYDFCHIDQKHTPQHVVKKFLITYCSDPILEYFELFEEVEIVRDNIIEMIDANMRLDDPKIIEPLERVLTAIEGFGDAIGKKIQINMYEVVRRVANLPSIELPEGWLELERRISKISKKEVESFRSQALQTVADLGIAELVRDQAMTAKQLAVATGADEHAIYSVMRFLAGQGVNYEQDGHHFSLIPDDGARTQDRSPTLAPRPRELPSSVDRRTDEFAKLKGI